MNSKITAFLSLIVISIMILTCFASTITAEDTLTEGGTLIENKEGADESSETAISGECNTGFTITAPEGTVVKATMNNLVVVSPTNSSISIIGDVILTVVGTCNLAAASGFAAISVNEGNSLTIVGGEGANTLTVKGGYNAAAIGSDAEKNSGNIVIDCDKTTIVASTTSIASKENGAAFIGGGHNGSANITIKSGNIDCTNTPCSVAIGAGNVDNDHNKIVDIDTAIANESALGNTVTAKDVIDINGVVLIEGGNIKANGTIGGGKHTNDSITITGGNVDVRNGYIGNTYGTSQENSPEWTHAFTKISIKGDAKVSSITYVANGFVDDLCDFENVEGNKLLSLSATAPDQAINAAIGSAYGSDTEIEISGSANVRAITVTRDASNCKWYQGASGIGSGYHGVAQITIDTVGKIFAIGACSAPGIGDGALATNYNITVDDASRKTGIINPYEGFVKISSGEITSYGGVYAAGIGGGRGSAYVDIEITGGKITAIGGGYATSDKADKYFLPEGVVGGGAGIGAGYGGSLEGDSKASHYNDLVSMKISITGDSNVSATGTHSDGIGAGNGTIDTDTTVSIIVDSNNVSPVAPTTSEKVYKHSLVTISIDNGTCAIADESGNIIDIVGSKYVKDGTKLIFTPSANSGYRFGTSNIEAVDGVYSITVSEDTTIEFTFDLIPVIVTPPQVVVIPTYNVDVPAGNGFSVEPINGTSILSGGSFSFTVDFADGYNTDNSIVKVNGEIVTPVNGIYTISNISDNQTVEVTGCVKEYSLDYIDENNSTAGVDMDYVLDGDSLNIDVVPNDGFIIDDVVVTVDGITIENAYSNGMVTIDNVNGNIVITVNTTEITTGSVDIRLVGIIIAAIVCLFAIALIKKRNSDKEE